MEGKVLKNYNVNTNDFEYKKDEIIEVIEFPYFRKKYGIFREKKGDKILDWIPKEFIEVIYKIRG